jgi:predicted ribosome-associated RNA-binding protein Tma20|tara:strand:- start:1585 stop:2019 length:435 start_codon:yes stop_codon:yes gene_type:complete
MIVNREIFVSTVDNIEEKEIIYINLRRNKDKFSVATVHGKPILYKNYIECWDFIEKFYNLAIKHNTAIVVIENETKTKLSFGLGKAVLLKKFEDIQIRENTVKRMKNIRRRMVVDSKYKSSKKKIDTRIFDRTRYASSSNKGIG